MLQADAYAGFNELYRNGRITEAACWAHARRKIHDEHTRTPSALTEEALKRIGELYAIEAEIRGMSAEQRLAERQQKAKLRLELLTDHFHGNTHLWLSFQPPRRWQHLRYR